MKNARLINKLRNAGLTEREADTATLVTMGLSNAEIGNQFFCSEKTVKTNVYKIYAKLGVKTRAQLIVACLPFTDQADKYTDLWLVK